MANAIGMGVPQTIEQFRALCQQAETYSQHPPENGQVLTDMHEQFLIAAGRFPGEDHAIDTAIGHIGQALGRIGEIFRAEMREMERARQATPHQEGEGDVLQPQVEEQLIPPDPAAVNHVVDQFMQIANDLFAQQRAPQPALATQSVPESNRLGGIMTAVGAPPHIPAPVPVATTPITNISTTPSQQPVALEPSLLNRVLQVFQNALETMYSWVSWLISSIFCYQNPQLDLNQAQIPATPQQQIQVQPPAAQNLIPAVSTPPLLQSPVVQTPTEPASAAEQPPQAPREPNPAPVTPVVVQAQPADEPPAADPIPDLFQGVGHIERGEEQGIQCAKAMARRLWIHLLGNRDDNQLSALVSAAVVDQNGGIPLEDFVFNRLGLLPTQAYANEMAFLNVHATRARINAAMIMKGDEIHLVMIDARTLAQPKFYYFNPYAENAYVQRFDHIGDLAAHLGQAVPVDADIPFRIRGLRVVNPNLQN